MTSALLAAMVLPVLLLLVSLQLISWAEPPEGTDQREPGGSAGSGTPKPRTASLSSTWPGARRPATCLALSSSRAPRRAASAAGPLRRAWSRSLAFCQTLRRDSVRNRLAPSRFNGASNRSVHVRPNAASAASSAGTRVASTSSTCR